MPIISIVPTWRSLRGVGEAVVYLLDMAALRPQQAVREAVWLCNYERPHLALKYQTPYQAYINASKFSLSQ